MFARPPRKVAVPTAVRTCPSCDGDVPAGNRFCGICGARARGSGAEQLTEQDQATQRHAELLSGWLEPEVKRSSRLKPALLGSVVVPLLVVGAYVVFHGKPIEPVGAGANAAVPTGSVEVDDEMLGDSALASSTAVDVTPREARIAPDSHVRLGALAVQRSAPGVAATHGAGSVARASGVLQMLVTPWASVSIDGRAGLRRARGADTLVADIPHRLHFERPGFATIDTTVTLRPGEQHLLEVQMTAMKP